VSDKPQTTDAERQIRLVREVALTCLNAGRKKADFIIGADGRPMGFQDWAEQEFRKLLESENAE
jgi:hypothetical protein